MNIFEFLDYRELLKDYFAQLQRKNASFSYRAFNRKAGIKSPGFIKRILSGERNLSEASIHKVAQGLGLKDSERRYFENLVRFNQAEDAKTKEHYFQLLLQNKNFLRAKPLRSAQYKLFSQWYYVAILELMRLSLPGKKDVLWFQRHLCEEVGVREIKMALKDLKVLGFIKEDRQGNLTRQDPMITTPDEVGSILLAKFYQKMAALAHENLQEPAQEKEFSSLTIAVSPESFRRVRNEIQNFRRKLHGMLEEIQEPKSKVAHLSMQWFTISK